MEDDATRTERALTEHGAVVGSAAYMSPEQAEGKKVDARSDIFSFGLVLYEMLTARKAFSQNFPLLILTSILRDEPRPIAEIVPGIAPDLVQVIQRALPQGPRPTLPDHAGNADRTGGIETEVGLRHFELASAGDRAPNKDQACCEERPRDSGARDRISPGGIRRSLVVDLARLQAPESRSNHCIQPALVAQTFGIFPCCSE